MTYRESSKLTRYAGTSKTPADCGCGCHTGKHPGDCGCGCGCQERTDTHTAACCCLVCFERPNYFCGHLLSDADLTLEQTYLREKNKLYHRTIDGDGVVCGLRLTCDPRCDGHISVSEGYAIDCCGNDLVVCEPKTFDVLGELRKRNWVVEMPKDPCDEHTKKGKQDDGESAVTEEIGDRGKKEEEENCIGKQCFYVGICYVEEDTEFITPFQTDCSPGPSACQPTRIREGVCFELYDELPVRPNALDEIEKRIERCFRIFREGQFSKGLGKYAQAIQALLDVGNEDSKRTRDKPSEVFCSVRALFLHQLRVCPDQYNCNLEHEVWKICPPGEQPDRQAVGEAFTRLFELIQRYVFSCILAEFAFCCAEPPEKCCVLIGSVEIEHGRLTRVLNYPRWYLWCFANFFEVLIYTLANEAACGRDRDRDATRDYDEHSGETEGGCCPGFEVNVTDFLTLFTAENRAAEFAARSSVQAIRAVSRALRSGFDFTKPRTVATQVFRNMPFAKAQELVRTLGLPPLEHAGDTDPSAVDPITALLANLNQRFDQPLAVFEKGATGQAVVTGATRILAAPASAVVGEAASALLERIAKLEDEVKALRSPADSESKETRTKRPKPGNPNE